MLNGSSLPHKNFDSIQRKQSRKPNPKPPKQLSREPPLTERELKPSLFTFTESSNRSTPRLVSPRSPWALWIQSSTTFSRRLPANHLASLVITRDTLSHPLQFKLPLDSSFPENSPNTPFPKEPRPSPNTHLRETTVNNVSFVKYKTLIWLNFLLILIYL